MPKILKTFAIMAALAVGAVGISALVPIAEAGRMLN